MPTTKPKPKPFRKTKTEKPELQLKLNRYHAVGILTTDVSFDEEGKTHISLDGKQYDLMGQINNKQALRYLRNFVEETGNSRQKLIVYPRILHLPQKDVYHQTKFILVGYEGKKKCQEPSLSSVLRDREFLLSGTWKFISCCKCPVIAVKRNFTEEKLSQYRDMNETIQQSYTKPVYCPVYWKDSSVKPFRFNPRSKEQMDEYFVEIRANFIPKKDAFGFQESLAEPKLEHPKSIAHKKKKAK